MAACLSRGRTERELSGLQPALTVSAIQPPPEAELRSYISDLNDDEKASLVALMWIGRDTYEPEDLAEAIATAKAEATAPTEDYLLGVPLLSDYLEAGLEKFGISIEEAEEGLL